MTREQVVGLLAEVLQQISAKGPLRVGIDGRHGAGKTRLGNELADVLESKGRPCHRASLEEFHKPGHQRQLAGGAMAAADYIDHAYDFNSIRKLLLNPLGPGGDRRCRLDLWNCHDDEPFPEDWVDVSEDAIVVVDGAFLLTSELRDSWDCTIWLDIDWQVMSRRAAHRASEAETGDPPAAGTASEWMERHSLYERKSRPRERVDVIVDNSDLAHPYIVRIKPNLMPRRVYTTP